GLWNNEQSIKSIEGIDIAWVEEAQTISKASLEVLTPTVRKAGSQIIYTYNRLTINDPVHTRLVDEGRPNTLIINTNYDVAEKYGLLPDVIKQEIEDDKLKRPILYKQKWLGEPYVSPNDLLSELALTKCLSPELNAQGDRVIIGVDTGHDIYYTLMNKHGVFYHGYCRSPQEMNDPDYDPYKELERRLKEYPQSILVSDQGGDLIGIRKLQAKYPGRVYLCWFTKETRDKHMIRWGEKAEHGKVLVDRNRMFQLVVDQINEQRIVFNGTAEDWQPFFEQCLNIYRVKEITGDENDPQYGWRWVWKRKGPDHFFLTLIYALVGMDRFGKGDGKIFGGDELNFPISAPVLANNTIMHRIDMDK
ncbi:MAG: phage terminase large subunit, partial [Candidatus Paceibacterota bacterium]